MRFSAISVCSLQSLLKAPLLVLEGRVAPWVPHADGAHWFLPCSYTFCPGLNAELQVGQRLVCLLIVMLSATAVMLCAVWVVSSLFCTGVMFSRVTSHLCFNNFCACLCRLVGLPCTLLRRRAAMRSWRPSLTRGLPSMLSIRTAARPCTTQPPKISRRYGCRCCWSWCCSQKKCLVIWTFLHFFFPSFSSYAFRLQSCF